MRRLSWGIAAGVAVALSGCVTPVPRLSQTATVDDFALIGRVLVRKGERADVLRLAWQHEGETDHVRLETSLGQTVAEVDLNAARAHVKLGDGREFEREDDVMLAEDVLGVPLPLRRFADWVRALPSAQAGELRRDERTRLVGAVEGDWTLAYSGYGEAGLARYPALIEARSGDVLVRLKVETWSAGDDTAP